jgi:hypothetical protein
LHRAEPATRDKMQKMQVTPSTLLAIAALGCSQPTPSLVLVEPGLLCHEQGGATLRLEGSALEPAVQQALTEEPSLLLPSIRLEPVGGAAQGAPASATEAVLVDPTRVAWVEPSAVEIRVDSGLGLEPGSWDVVVATRTGHEARMAAALTVLGPPVLGSVTPDRACHESAALELQLEGSGFLVLEGASPTVSIGASLATVLGGTACVPLAGSVPGSLCDGLVLDLDCGTLALGDVELIATNPEPAACSSESGLLVEVVLPPDIDEVEPGVVCSSGGIVRVHGGPFVEGTTASLGEIPVVRTTVVSSTLIEIETGADAPRGSATLTLHDPSGCEVSIAEAFELVRPPQAFHVEPSVVPYGAALEATALLADVNAGIEDAWLVHSSGEERAVDWAWSEELPSELGLLLPDDLAEGDWRLGLQQAEACPGIVAGGFEVVRARAVALGAVEPPHAWTFDHTAVEITTTDPIPSGSEGFADVPELYLLGPEGTERSERVLGVRYHDEQRLTAIVPPNLEPGSYDLLAVNPDGDYGLLEAAIEVTWDAPPSVETVSPATLEKASDQSIVLHGANYRDPTVSLSCLEGGITSEVDAAVDAWAFGSIHATLSTRGFNQALCVVQVTNSDGTSARWSAISITNPAQNLFPFEDGSALVQARRAPAGAAGRTTSMDRYVYAIGGDTGSASGALSSAEVAPVDPWGAMDAWSILPASLPSPRTLAGSSTVDSFVYLVGGDDGAGPVASVLRAIVLDPLDVPWLDSVSLESSADAGLEAGRWTYRVSALFDASHTSNPLGESMAGEPVSLTLPASEEGWLPTVCWTAVDQAVAYRVYRSASPDAPSSTLTWLADTPDARTCFQDVGDAVDGTNAPPPEGSLGNWAQVATLDRARSAPCVALAKDPALDPEIYHLYVAGGMATDGSLLDSIEVLDITVESESLQSVAAPWTLDQRLSEARWQCAGYVVSDALHSVVESGESWVLFAGGEGEHNATGTVDLGLVHEDGGLESWGTTRSLSPARAGFAHASASNFLYAFGGQQGSPSTSGTSAEIEHDGGIELHNWNSLGDGMHTARWLPGSAQESAVIFVLGGQTDSADATTSTEYTHY